MTVEYESLFVPVAVPEDLTMQAQKRGWPEDAIQRMRNLRWDRVGIEQWLGDNGPTAEEVVRRLADAERLAYGTIRGRALTYGDSDALAELFENSPEEIGEWDVTVCRSPDAFAQFVLMENPIIWVLEDRKVLLGSFAIATKNCLVNGKRITVSLVAAWRTRKEVRGMGFSQLIRNWGVSVGQPFAPGQFWYVRSENVAAVKWMQALGDVLRGTGATDSNGVPGLPVTVMQYPAAAFTGDGTGIRLTRRGDARRAAALINRTHKGLDLFRPYTAEYLSTRLDEGFWGTRPSWWRSVYSWRDHFVLEEDGAVVACAGLWDRGRDIREVWRNRETGEEKTIETTNVLDFGFLPGRADAMARLIAFLVGKTHDLGRQFLVVPLQFLPGVSSELEPLGPVPETRGLLWRMWRPEPGAPYENPPLAPVRPYTDLAYW